MRIAIDAMGGDFAPAEIVAGVLQAADHLDAELSVVGEPQAMAEHLGAGHPRITVEPAHDVIAMEESPRRALRGLSSIAITSC
ncbi:MAG: phosphate acyltransferase, partial [Armatimonadetes bacterium]|nr:phosphate acyltransferase [Armatimonadota bacterium]